jgi:hypothetical protein
VHEEGERVGGHEPAAALEDVDRVQRVQGRDKERLALADLPTGAEDILDRVEIPILELASPASLEEAAPGRLHIGAADQPRLRVGQVH